MPDAGLMPNKI